VSVPNWAIALTIEIIILLVLITVFLAFAWRISSGKKQKMIEKLQAQLHQQQNQLKTHKGQEKPADAQPSQTSTQASKASKALEEEIELLKIQLAQARENPFLQEKIDALTAENEDLQTQLQAYRAQD
jgi:uncharacterized ion transporter superfamily protein YfcC